MHNWCVEFQFWRMNLHHELKQDCFFEGINCFCVCIYLFIYLIIFGLIIVNLYIKNVCHFQLFIEHGCLQHLNNTDATFKQSEGRE